MLTAVGTSMLLSGCGGGGSGSATDAPATASPGSTASGPWTVQLSWAAVSAPGVYGYRVYRGNSASDLAMVSGLVTDTSYQTTVDQAGTYYFAVRAVDAYNIESAASATASVSVP
jgi:fibronectin type 3 domain-containing protein